jgi:CDP-4-dehydro-6-deoxyglucose reductase
MAWWTAKHRRFDFRVTYTGDDPPEGARFTGRIPAMLDLLKRDLSGHSIYTAGRPEFVDACVDACRALGAGDDHVFVERYTPQSPAEVPPPHQLT